VAQELRIAAASDLGPALARLTPGMERAAGRKVVVIQGSSGSLYAQIRNQAPFDLFLSADVELPERLRASGEATGQVERYARGILAVVAQPGVAMGSEAGSLRAALTRERVKRVAVANPLHAPYGRAAMELLRRLGIEDAMKEKLARGENVAQAAQFVQSGQAEMAITAMSLALRLRQEGYAVAEVDERLHGPIEQAGVVLRASADREAAARALEYLQSAEAQAILGECGFRPPGTG
jgi:molybdate transport system substrate-binding protein